MPLRRGLRDIVCEVAVKTHDVRTAYDLLLPTHRCLTSPELIGIARVARSHPDGLPQQTLGNTPGRAEDPR
jgi:hypothetical protein